MRTAAWEEVQIEVGPGREVPLLGVVAAGRPFEAFPAEDVLALPSRWWSGRKVFALRVRGSSMADEGIRDGDHLIVEPRERAEVGQTVVAEVDGGVTVKRLFLEADGRVRLQPANPEMLPLVLAPERARVVGVVVGVFRRQGFRRGGPRPTSLRTARASDGETLDLTLRVIERSLDEARALAARQAGPYGARVRELAQGLRALRDCYLETKTPRLRAALLREAGELVARLRGFGAEPSGP